MDLGLHYLARSRPAKIRPVRWGMAPEAELRLKIFDTWYKCPRRHTHQQCITAWATLNAVGPQRQPYNTTVLYWLHEHLYTCRIRIQEHISCIRCRIAHSNHQIEFLSRWTLNWAAMSERKVLSVMRHPPFPLLHANHPAGLNTILRIVSIAKIRFGSPESLPWEKYWLYMSKSIPVRSNGESSTFDEDCG